MPSLEEIMQMAQNAQAELQKAQDNLDKVEVEVAIAHLVGDVPDEVDGIHRGLLLRTPARSARRAFARCRHRADLSGQGIDAGFYLFIAVTKIFGE